jgi:hypothetical protein
MAGEEKQWQDRLAEIDVLVDQSEDDDLSEAAALGGGTLVGIRTPAALTSTTLTLKAAGDENTSYLDVYDESGNQITIQIGVDRHIMLAPSDWASVEFLKLSMGSNEAADRTFVLLVRPVG